LTAEFVCEGGCWLQESAAAVRVRGARVQKKRQERQEGATRPVTIVLIDDRKQDAYGNCQVPLVIG
jgi:hypothetical protein